MSTERLKRRLDRLRTPRPTYARYDAAMRRNASRAIVIAYGAEAGQFHDFFDRDRASQRRESVREAKVLLKADTPALWRSDQEVIDVYEGGYAGKPAWPFSQFKKHSSIEAVVAVHTRKADKVRRKFEAIRSASTQAP